MPIIKSAKKRVKVSAKARSRNQRTKSNLREALKRFAKALEAGKPAEINKARVAADSAIDMAAKKDVIHANKAARFKSRLATQAKKAGVKPEAAKSPKLKAKSSKPKAKNPAKAKTAAAKSGKKAAAKK